MLDYILFHKRFWADKWVRELTNDSARLLYVALMSQAQINSCGIYELDLDVLSLAVRNEPFIPALLDQFERDGKIIRDRSWVWIVNFTEHQQYNAKSFAGALRECKGLRRKTKLAERWLDHYTILNENGQRVRFDVKPDDLADLTRTRNGRPPITSDPITSHQVSAADATAPFLQLAEELHAFAETLATEGYAVEKLTPERLAAGLSKSGLPLPDLREMFNWAQQDPYHRANLGQHSRLLNGGMFKTMHNDRLTWLAKQRQKDGGSVYGSPSTPVYQSVDEALAPMPVFLPGDEVHP